MPVRVLDDHGEGDASDIAAGVRFATRHGAQVINLSLEFSTDVTASEIPELVEALAYAHRHGVFLVGAPATRRTARSPTPRAPATSCRSARPPSTAA